MRTRLSAAIAVLLFTGCETMNINMDSLTSLTKTSQPLTTETIIEGLKEALRVGTENTVKQLSEPGGYNQNETLRIPFPEQLDTVSNTLRKVGLGGIIDNFENKVNTAAEQAASDAVPIFVNALSEMSFDDAKAILSGGETAATEYFRNKTYEQLKSLYKPQISEAVNKVGAAGIYQQLLDRYRKIPFTAKPEMLSLEDYVTSEAVDGLFTVLAQEEQKIRTNPAARTTELLRKVFGK